MLPTSERFVETLARLYNYPEPHANAQLTRPLTIAISRQAGSRGPDIAQAVGARLGWHVFDHELLTRIAEEKGVPAQSLEHLDEHYYNWIESVMNSFFVQGGSLEGVYLKQLVQLLASLSKVGHCIVVGRGAAQVLPVETTLRVRIVAPLAWRVSETQKRLGITHDEAERWVQKTDNERTQFVKHCFHKDTTDPAEYDLTLNSGRYGVDECAEIVVQAARLLESRGKA